MNSAMFEAWRQAEVIMGAVPSCDRHQIYQARDSGDPKAVLREANFSGANGLLGLIRGRIAAHFSRDSMEALYLFCDVERLRRREWSQPQIGLTAVWDYLENLPRRFKVISEVSVLPRDLEVLAGRVKSLVFGDLREEITDLQSQAERILCDWRNCNLAEAVEIARRVDEIPSLIVSGQEFAARIKESRDDGERRQRRRSSKEERRRRNQSWWQRLYPAADETEQEELITAAS